MRKNIYDVLHVGEISLKTEYDRLYALLHQDNLCAGEECMSIYRLAEHACKYFDLEFTNRAISLKEIEKAFGYNFSPSPRVLTIDTIISYCELIFNLCYQLNKIYKDEEIDKEYLTVVNRNVEAVMDALGYIRIEHKGVYIYVEKDPASLAVAEIVDKELSYVVLEYNHHRLKGDLIAKLGTLKLMADDIEPKRKNLNAINRSLSDLLFQMLQKFVRHNNTANAYISSLSDGETEAYYDDIYQMWLLAKLELDNVERKNEQQGVLNR